MRVREKAPLQLRYIDPVSEQMHIRIGAEIDEDLVVYDRLASCPLLSAADLPCASAYLALTEQRRHALARPCSEKPYPHPASPCT